MAVVRRRLDYEADPAGFAARYAGADREVAEKILAARDRISQVVLDDVELRRIAALCAAFDVDGMRADLVVARTATAHAAWRGGAAVTEADVRVAAELALPHRRRRDPFDEPGISDEQLDDAMRDAAAEAQSPAQTGESELTPPSNEEPGERGPSDDPEDPSPPDGPGGGKAPEGHSGAPVSAAATPPRWEVSGVGEGAPGRRSRAESRHGRVVRSSADTSSGLHLLGTVFAAAPHQRARGRGEGPLKLASDDLRGAYREGREGNLVVFVVDASGSMAARDRLSAVTGAVVALLRDAYQRRDKVAVITLRGTEAELVLPPTSSVDIAVRRLSGMRTGGKTPVAAGLLKARDVVRRERVRDPRRRPMLVLLTDGRATGGVDPVGRGRAAARLLAADAVTSIVVDCERGMIRLGLAADLARDLRGGYLRLAELTGDSVADIVRAGSGRVSVRAA